MSEYYLLLKTKTFFMLKNELKNRIKEEMLLRKRIRSSDHKNFPQYEKFHGENFPLLNDLGIQKG